MRPSKPWKISVIDSKDATYSRRRKWGPLLAEIEPQVLKLQKGKSIKIQMTDVSQVMSFKNAAANWIKNGAGKDMVVGISRTDKCVYIGRKE